MSDDKNKENKSKEYGEACIRHFEQLSGRRGNWEALWEEIAQRVLPSHSQLFQSKGAGRTDGAKRTEYIYDSTASIALERFGAILDSMLTPRNQKWHRLTVSDKSLARDRQVKLYFEEANQVLFKYRYAPKANYASQNQQNYQCLGAFGTGSLFIDALANEPGFRYKAMHLGEIYFAENHQGQIDTAYRHFEMTCRQAIQKWGEKLPKKIIEAAKTDPSRTFWFLHVVKPRGEDFDPGRLDHKGMPFTGDYISFEEKCVVEEGGFTTFPYPSSRYTQAPGEVYGRGPIMSVLPAIKTLNEQKKTVLKQGQRTVDPVYLMHDDGILDTFSVKPGAMVAGGVDAQGRPLVHTLPTGRIDIGKELMDDERAVINDSCLVTLFQILTENPTMTATEVIERTKEKGILLSPTVGRQQDEYLGPKIERELDLASRQGLLPPMPKALIEAKGEYKIEYDSPMSRAAKAEEASGIARTIETVLNIVNVTQDPAPLDHFNWDQIVPSIAEIQGVPAAWMRGLDEVQQIREGRAQQAETEQAIAAAPGAAALANAAVKAKGK